MTQIQIPLHSVASRCPINTINGVLEWSIRIPLREQIRPNDSYYMTALNDSLPGLAHKFYSDVSLWWVIYDVNASQLLDHPLDLPVGITLTIPDKSYIEQELLHDRNF
jgi:hypothetical protein